ncbi:cytochrome-c oxidase [Abortiporus biennis]|nr:cytochrome-c oxidase [Abortiporus biennis]
MPIAPIVGKLRKRFWLDLTTSLALGTTAGYAFWYGVHLKKVQRQEEYYLKLEQQKQQA